MVPDPEQWLLCVGGSYILPGSLGHRRTQFLAPSLDSSKGQRHGSLLLSSFCSLFPASTPSCWRSYTLPCGSLLTEGGGLWAHQLHGEVKEGQHELNDQGPVLRPPAVDVLQEFSVYVFVSHMS